MDRYLGNDTISQDKVPMCLAQRIFVNTTNKPITFQTFWFLIQWNPIAIVKQIEQYYPLTWYF